jgi:hypothetical protein
MSSTERQSQDWADDISDTPMSDATEAEVEGTKNHSNRNLTTEAADAIMAATILTEMHEYHDDIPNINTIMEVDGEDAAAIIARVGTESNVRAMEGVWPPAEQGGEHHTQGDEANQDAIVSEEIAKTLEALAQADAEAAEAIADLADIQNRTEECTVCYEALPLSQVLLMACKEHWICKDHIKDYIQRAVESQANYPPRCCDRVGRIELNVVDHWLPDDLVANYLFKQEEYQTDVRLRCYCSNVGCHRFLPPTLYEDIADGKHTVADCGQCHRSTCVVCKTLVSKEHTHECISVLVNEVNQAYSSEMRFKACPFCGRFGQLENACNHVTCLGENCLGEWCFVCVETWNGGDGHDDCLRYNDPVYDEEGYDERGFHRDTGFDRDGFTRGGYDIRGRNRDGQRMAGFAERIISTTANHGHVAPGFAHLEENDLRDAIMIQVLDEQSRGIILPDENLEHVIQERVFIITGRQRRHVLGVHRGGRRRWIGGIHRQGGLAQAPLPIHNGGFDGEFDEERDDGGENQNEAQAGAIGDVERAEELHPPLHAENNNQDARPGVEAEQHEIEINRVLEDVGDEPQAMDHRQDDGIIEQGVGDDGRQNDEGDNAVRQAENGAEEDGDGEENNNVNLAPPAGPTFQQRHCNHNFEMQEGGSLCSVCQWHTDVEGNSFHFFCNDCEAITCGNCSFEYAASVLMNWPGIDDLNGEAEGEDQQGGQDARMDREPAQGVNFE